LKEKPLDKITIKDICDGCHMNRQTFYYHFMDIYDLIEWMYTNAETEILSEYQPYLSWEKGLSRIFAYALQEKEFVTATYHSISREHLENFLYRETYRYLYEFITKYCEGHACKEEDIRLIADFYKYAFVGFVLDWVGKGMKEDPNVMMQKLKMIAEHSFFHLFTFLTDQT